MKQAIIFSRCSSSGSLESRQDTTRQVEDLQRYADSNNIKVTKIFQEHISGGTANNKRPILQEAMSWALNPDNHIDIILVSELSRLGRSVYEVQETIKKAVDANINIFFQKENIELLNPDGSQSMITPIIITVLSVCSTIEKSSIQYRLKSGRDKYIRDGGKLGKPKGSGIKTKPMLETEYKAVIRNLKSGQSVRNTAKICGVSCSTVQRVKKTFCL